MGQQEAHLGARSRLGERGTPPAARGRSPSLKRSAEEKELQASGVIQPGQVVPWSTVASRQQQGQQGRKPRPVQYGTAKVTVAGAEARPYDVVIGNTNPGSTVEIIKEVLQEVAQEMSGENKLGEPLQILEVECLTKPRADGSRI